VLKTICSKNPHKRTPVLMAQADFVFIYRMFSAESAGKCSKAVLKTVSEN